MIWGRLTLKRFIAPAFLCWALVGCFPKYYSLRPVEAHKKTSVWTEDGIDYLVSKKRRSTVIIAGVAHNERREFRAHLKVKNRSGRNVRFVPAEHVEVFFVPESAEKVAHPLRMYSFDQYLALLNRRQASEAGWATFANSMAVANAGTGSVTSRTDASVSYSDNRGVSGTGYGSATTTSTYTDPVARELAQRRAERNMQALRQNQSREYNDAADSLLRRTTIRPGKQVKGFVYAADGGWSLSSVRNDRLVIRVHVGSERHTLHFTRRR